MTNQKTSQKLIPYIFSFTLFVSAVLVFSVQPMLGKMMLPHVGGAPSGWAVTMFFFQTCLLLGYALAFVFSKLPPFLNALAILFMFIPATLFLPIAYHSGIVDSISPWAVFLQLTASTAVPFLALSTLAPGLQRLFSFSNHETANDPYYLYAASNLGSFVGLLAYPFVLEPLIGLQTQSQTWMMAFSLLFFGVLLCCIMIFVSKREFITLKIKTKKNSKKDTGENITWKRRLKWLALAAIPSSLMIGTTTEITTDIASAPMIWVIPLSLYLLTNIIAFAKRQAININTLSALHVIATIFVVCLFVSGNYNFTLLQYSVLIALGYMAAFTVTALLLHSILANDRPDTSKLTEFYLMLALGGAIGGSFNAFIAPSILNDAYEFQFVFVLSLLMSPLFVQAFPDSLKKMSRWIAASVVVVLIVMSFQEHMIFSAALLFLILLSCIHTKLLFATSLATLIFLVSPLAQQNVLYVDRNFFGVIKVKNDELSKEPLIEVKSLHHGTTMHGFESPNPELAYKPFSYYGVNGPVGDIINTQDPQKIAVLGLGVGQIACHKKKGREFTFYEIDPHVVEVALEHFSIMKTCGYKDIVVGDARLELAKDKNQYDMIVVDTFSSDAIPVHLITTEAIELYMSKLKKNKVILLNISNRHLDIKKPLAAIADHLGLHYRAKFYNSKEDDHYNFASEWAIITKDKKFAESLDKKDWKKTDVTIRPWTDDYSNFIATLKSFHSRKPKKTNALDTEQDKE